MISVTPMPASVRRASGTRRSIARLCASVLSRHTQFSVAFTTNIAESNFRHTQPLSRFDRSS